MISVFLAWGGWLRSVVPSFPHHVHTSKLGEVEREDLGN